MFGESLLAAPVIEQGKTEWRVYLPSYRSSSVEGPTWIDVSSNFKYDENDGRYRIGSGRYYDGGQYVCYCSISCVIVLFLVMLLLKHHWIKSHSLLWLVVLYQ